MRLPATAEAMRFKQLADWLAWQQTLHPRQIDLGLTRVKQVFEVMRPGYQAPLTITVGGTNGKGSCIALLEAILRAQGYRVGAYSSPHILRYNERIRIDGKLASDRAICEVFDRIDQAREARTLSFFEFGTLAALELFVEAAVDVQLMEVGLGGRLDAVNIVDADIALIASIDIDHKGWLGETREAIGLEKAGILRSDRPAIVGDLHPPSSLLNHGREIGAEVYRLGVDFDYHCEGRRWQWRGSMTQFVDLPLPGIPGRQQLANASSVLEVLSHVKKRLPVSETAVRKGLQQAYLPGRYQLIPGKPDVFLDVAHNPQAAQLLASYLRQEFSNRRIVALFSAMSDKDIDGIVANMQAIVESWFLAPLATPRAATENRILKTFRRLRMKPPQAGFRDFETAWRAVNAQVEPNDLIVIFGSFFLVSAYMSGPGRLWNPV